MRLCLSVSLVVLAACSSRVAVKDSKLIAPVVKPDDPPLPPFEPPFANAEAMNTEYYLGSKAEEEAQLKSFAEQIQGIQDQQSKDRSQPVQRGFHAKAHGCVFGTFELAANRPASTRFGLFAEGQSSHPVWVRFSNGVGWVQGDKELDARGMAVKMLGVDGPKLLSDEKGTQDFLMTNSPTPIGRNAEEFMGFAHANANGKLSSYLFLLGHPNTAAPAMLKTDPVPSMVTTQYWGGGAYHLGSHQAVKFTAKSCAGTKPREPGKDDPDYLTKDLAAAAKEGLCFDFFVQLQVDPEKTPIEHASYEWKEDVSPPLKVGTLRFPPQDLTGEKREAFCKSLSYNPWHAIAAHQPMGHINRARRFVYPASAAHRQGGHEPEGFEGFDSPAPAATSSAP